MQKVSEQTKTRLAYAAIGLIAAGLFALRLTVPIDILAYAQDMPAMYVLDAVVNGHWFCQRDALGSITSKPPLYTWLAGLASLPSGHVTSFSLALPSGLATLGTAWVILAAGRKWWSRRAGLWAALIYLLSPMAGKQLALVRTDSLFTFTVALAAVAAFAAWERGRGWTWFWLAAAAATLTKGPLGVLLGALGLCAALWERRSGQPAALRGQHFGGVALYGVLTLGWLALALVTEGRAVVDKMIFRELIGHATGSSSKEPWLVNSYKPLLYVLARFAPWSLLTCLAFWRAVRQPSPVTTERRFERFLCCWLGLGVAVLSSSSHVRPDLAMPLIPAAALLAGRELNRWTARLPQTFVAGFFLVLAAVGMAWVTGPWFAKREAASVQHTRGTQILAKEVTVRVGAEFPLTYVDRTFALQFFLGTMRERVAPATAVRLLSEPTPVFVVARRSDKLSEQLGPSLTNLHEVARWPAQGEAYITVLSNHPRLEWTEQLAFGVGPFIVHAEGLRLKGAHKNELWFSAARDTGTVRITNEGTAPQRLRLRITGPQSEEQSEREVEPGETWVEDIP